MWEKSHVWCTEDHRCAKAEKFSYVCLYFSTQHQPCTENSLWKPNGFQDTGTGLDVGANFHSLSIQEFDAYLPHPALLDSCPKMVFSGWWGYRTVGSQLSFWISYDFVDTNANPAEQDNDNNAKTELAVFNMKYRGIGVGHYPWLGMNYPVLRPLRWFSSEMQLNTPKVRDNPYGNAPLRAVNLSPGIVTGTCRCTPVLMLLAFSHVEQSMEFPRYAFLVTPYLGGLVKSICDAILGVSLGLVAVSYLAEQWLNRSKKIENGDVPEDRWFWREHNGVFLRRFGMFWGSMILVNSFAALV